MLSASQIEFICFCIFSQFLFGFLILTLFPFLVFQWLITKVRILCSQHVKKILGRISCTYTVDSIEENTGNNVIFRLNLEGKLDVRKTLGRISALIHRKNDNGELLFPELQMYWIKWLGCPVWKLENNFSVSKHVIHAVIPHNSDKDAFISNFEKDMVRTPFKAKQSPWEIALVDGIDQPQCWYWLFKFHHSMADGHSVFKALMTCSDNFVPLYEPKVSKSVMLSKMLKLPAYPMIGMYEWIKLSLDSTLPNPWKMPVDQMAPNARTIVRSEAIPCVKISKISSARNVSFTAVLMAAVTGAVRNTLTKQGKSVPDYMVTRMPVPAPIKHSDGLTNNFTAVFMKLPTGTGDYLTRIQTCEKEIDLAKKSTCSLTAYLMTHVLGSLPSWLQKKFPSNFQAIQISNFPGPNQLITIGGQPVLDMHFIVWCTQRNPMYLSVLSYNGKIRLMANVDPSLFPSESSLGEFVHEVEKQLLDFE